MSRIGNSRETSGISSRLGARLSCKSCFCGVHLLAVVFLIVGVLLIRTLYNLGVVLSPLSFGNSHTPDFKVLAWFLEPDPERTEQMDCWSLMVGSLQGL